MPKIILSVTLLKGDGIIRPKFNSYFIEKSTYVVMFLFSVLLESIMTIHEALKNLKIETLNPMQLASIEAAKKQKDILLLSPTGSGKTLGFLLPILNNLEKDKTGVQALIVVPSRELSLQIEQVFKQMSTGFKINCCYGGPATRI